MKGPARDAEAPRDQGEQEAGPPWGEGSGDIGFRESCESWTVGAIVMEGTACQRHGSKWGGSKEETLPPLSFRPVIIPNGQTQPSQPAKAWRGQPTRVQSRAEIRSGDGEANRK